MVKVVHFCFVSQDICVVTHPVIISKGNTVPYDYFHPYGIHVQIRAAAVQDGTISMLKNSGIGSSLFTFN